MNKKILFTQAIFCLLLSFLSSSVFSQHVLYFQEVGASTSDDLKYKEHFKAYTLGTFDTKAASDLLRSQDYFKEITIETGSESFSFELHAKDLRPAHYKLRVRDETGIHEWPRSPNKTYYGYTSTGDDPVRITADVDFFNALIIKGNDEYYIEAANNFLPGAPENQYIIYKTSDNVNQMHPGSCGTDEHHKVHKHSSTDMEEQQDSPNRLLVCRVLQVALANDFEMFQEKGSISAVENHNMAVINNVLTNYDLEFTIDMEFDVVEIYVAANNGQDPWTNSTDANTLLDDFSDWGGNGFDNAHDVGGLWSNRDFNGDVVGLAWVGTICQNNFKYHILQDFTNNSGWLRCLQAHEMGHNFDANHDAIGSNTIMAPMVQDVNAWSTASLSSINSFMSGINCLSLCGTSSPPVAEFSADVTEGCDPLTVHFFDESSNNPTSWSWSFPGGSPSSSTSENPTVIYNTAGVYDVTLTVSNSAGSNAVTYNDFITVMDIPQADFDFAIDELSVDFENLTEDGETYFWEFGDGNTSTQTNPLHEYEEDGIYEVVLEASNDCGTDVFIVDIEIITEPTADFVASQEDGCDPFEVDFINYSSNNATSFFWSFPGGSPPTSTAFEPSIVYEIPGTFSVTLTAFNDAGEDTYTVSNYITVIPQPNATFTSTVEGLQATFNSAGSTGTSYLWNFGDGDNSSLQNPVHIYEEGGAYNVTLTVSNNCGTDVHTGVVTVVDAPVALFTSNVTEGCAPLVVQYTNQSLGLINSYSWVFEGGSPPTSNSPNPLVTYHSTGTFDVTLTVSNSVGSDVQFNSNYITVHPETISDFEYEVNGNTVVFTNLSNSSTSSTWTFGDGLVSDDDNPVHTYDTDGSYTVILTSEGLCGIDTSSAVVVIESLPESDFSFTQSSSCIPALVQFTNESSQNAISFAWSFPGGSPLTSTQENPLVTYNTAGTYDVQLIVFSTSGSDTLVMNGAVTVGASPDAGFLFTTDGTSVEVENLSTNADSYEWQFGDGEFSTELNPSHTYSEFGTYILSLIASNECGDDTMDVEIVLGNLPNASFSFLDQSGCAPFDVQFIDQSQNNPTSWLWTFEGGNPSTSTAQNPVVTYDSPGEYTVTLVVTNDQGSDSLILEDVIQIANLPDATFDHSVAGSQVALFYPGIDYDSLRWDFGDGRTDNSLNPTVQYSVSGTYLISLIIFNACGNDTASVSVVVTITSTDDPLVNPAQWQIRPNPFENELSIYGVPLIDGLVNITLFDVHGRYISTEEWYHKTGAQTKEILAHHLPSGILLVQIRDGNSVIVLRGVKQ